MRRRLKEIIVVALLIASAVGLYYFRGFSRIVELFHRQTAQRARPFQPASALLTQPATTVPVKLYFPSLINPGMLEEESNAIRASELDQNRAKQIILELIEGSKKNLGRTISSQAVLRELFLRPDGTAYVDFSDALQKEHPGGIECELQTLYSVVNSLTVNITCIKRVRFLIDDAEVETLAGHTDLLQAYTQDLNYIVKPVAAPAALPATGPKESPERRLLSAH
jgi:hypothetical protein